MRSILRIAPGLLLGLGLGALCRFAGLPASPRLVGALRVVALTAGFLAADKALP